jgi:hypothetical protein
MPLPIRQYPGQFATAFVSGGNASAWAVNFWRHFDFSGHPGIVTDGALPPNYFYDGVVFNGASSLLMAFSVPVFTYSTSPANPQFPTEIAYPPNRFGHNAINPVPLSAVPAPPFGGQPREYGTGDWWVGRLTMEETSHAGVQYPMLVHQVPNSPSDVNNDFNTASNWNDANGDAVIDSYASGPWRGEDLLLTNVHAFDVKVWDETLGSFVDVGHTLTSSSGARGDFHILNRNNNRYGATRSISDPTDQIVNPRDPTSLVGTGRRVFDTWYPFKTEDIDGDLALDPTEDTNSNGILDGGETDTDGDGVADGAEDGGVAGQIEGQLLDFDANGTVTANDSDGDGLIDFGENVPPYRPLVAIPVKPSPGGARVQYERWVANTSDSTPARYVVGDRVFPAARPYNTQFGNPFYYICVGTNEVYGDSGTISHGTTEPTWQRTAGLKTYDGDLIWQAVDNRKPLRAIQITLRFIDPTTGQMRTLTLQQSLVD